MVYGTTSGEEGFHSATAPAAARMLREVIRSRLGVAVAPEGDVALDVDGTIIVLEDDQVRPANDC